MDKLGRHILTFAVGLIVLAVINYVPNITEYVAIGFVAYVIGWFLLDLVLKKTKK